LPPRLGYLVEEFSPNESVMGLDSVAHDLRFLLISATIALDAIKGAEGCLIAAKVALLTQGSVG